MVLFYHRGRNAIHFFSSRPASALVIIIYIMILHMMNRKSLNAITAFIFLNVFFQRCLHIIFLIWLFTINFLRLLDLVILTLYHKCYISLFFHVILFLILAWIKWLHRLESVLVSLLIIEISGHL